MKKYFRFTQFNRNVIYFRSDKLGFGFVWRRNNSKWSRFGWLKITFDSIHQEYQIGVAYVGYNLIKAYKALKQYQFDYL